MSSNEGKIKCEIKPEVPLEALRNFNPDPSEEDSEGKAMVTGFTPFSSESQGQEPPVNYENIKGSLRVVPEFAAAMMKKVNLSLGSLDDMPYKLVSENESHKNAAREFFDNMNLEDVLRTSFFQIYTYGDLYWNLIESDESFSPISADTMKINTDEFGTVDSYVQTVDGNPASPLIFFPTDIVHLKLIDIGSEIYGFSTTEALIAAIVRLLKMENYNASFFNNNATPRGLWRFMGMSRKEYLRLMQTMKQIPPHKDLAAYSQNENGQIKYDQIGLTNKDMEYQQGLDYQQMKLIKGTDIPAIALGDPQNSNRATALTQMIFTMIPIAAVQRILADRITNTVIPDKLGFNDVKFIFNQADMRTKSEKATDQMKTITALTKMAKELGIAEDPKMLQAVQIKAFEVLGIPFDFSNSSKSKSLGINLPPTSDKESSTHFQDGSESAHDNEGPSKRKQVDDPGEDIKRQDEKFTDDVDKRISSLEKKFSNNYDKLEDKTVKIISDASKALEPSEFKPTMNIIANLIDSDESNFLAVGNADTEAYYHYQDHAANLANVRPGTPVDVQAINFLNESRFNAIKGVNDEMKKRIGFELSQSIRRGEGTAKIAKRIGTVFDAGKNRLNAIATTAIAEAMTEAELNQYKEAGIEKVDILLSNDEQTCELCIGLAGSNPYTLDEARGLIPAHVRCRCDFVPAS